MTTDTVKLEISKLQTELDALKVDKDLASKRVIEHKSLLTNLFQEERTLSALEQIGIDTTGIKVSNGKITQAAPR